MQIPTLRIPNSFTLVIIAWQVKNKNVQLGSALVHPFNAKKCIFSCSENMNHHEHNTKLKGITGAHQYNHQQAQ